MFKYLSILILTTIIQFCSFAQEYVVNWQKSYGGERNEVVYAGVETSDGGFIMVGSTNSKNSFDVKDSRGFDGTGGNDFWISKVSNTGSIVWSKTFGGSKEDIATSVVKTSNNEYLILGTTQSTDGDANFNGTNGGLLLVRLKENGDFVSKRLFAGGNSNSGVSFQQVNSFSKPSLKILPDGQIIVGATRSIGVNPFSGYDFYVAKLSPFGDTLWEKTFGGGLEDYMNDIIITSDGGYLMVGGTLSLERDISGAGQGFLDFLVIKIDGTGRQVWEKGFGGNSYDVAFSALENNSKTGFYIAGESSSTNGQIGNSLGEKDGIILRVDKNGLLLDKNHFGGLDNDGFYSLVRGADGVIYASGTSQSTIGTTKPKGTLTDVWLMALKEDTFIPIFHKLFGGADIDLARQVIYTSKSGLFLAASSRSADGDASLNRGQSDFWALNLSLPPPIIFGKFQAFLNGNQEIELVWTSTFEQNSQLIFIDKSADNKEFFQKDEQAAVGVSSGIVSYRFIDKNPLFGNNYYRLRYTDLANKFYPGPTISFNFSPLSIFNFPSDQFRVYPNPASEFILIDTFIENPNIRLVNSNGIEIPFELIKMGESSYKMVLKNGIAMGNYQVVVSNNISQQSKKIIVN
ncbi:T9SS type A sorting domain-containing protein [Lacihabitans sp. CCS-44]|uniref:T9SS type A sorting domain-containing protein n=1 Tax=Lacihabitans sp. CCS-44 TaxID=2487331 RepID=UPI0020CC2B9A|nr:T9SS type A sorting domain-containing protein [Lacihabitans sp. CCS-44]